MVTLTLVTFATNLLNELIDSRYDNVNISCEKPLFQFSTDMSISWLLPNCWRSRPQSQHHTSFPHWPQPSTMLLVDSTCWWHVCGYQTIHCLPFIWAGTIFDWLSARRGNNIISVDEHWTLCLALPLTSKLRCRGGGHLEAAMEFIPSL